MKYTILLTTELAKIKKILGVEMFMWKKDTLIW